MRVYYVVTFVTLFAVALLFRANSDVKLDSQNDMELEPYTVSPRLAQSPASNVAKPVLSEEQEHIRDMWEHIRFQGPERSEARKTNRGPAGDGGLVVFEKGLNSGQLVYGSTNHKTDGKSFLAIHDLRQVSPGEPVSTHPVLTYRPTAIGNEDVDLSFLDVSSPVFSPDGRYIAFRYNTGAVDNPLLFVLDTQTHETTLIPVGRFKYLLTSWSPDSNYIAGLQDGNWYGDPFDSRHGEIDYVGPLELIILNWRTGEEFSVALSDSLSGPFYWSGPDTLLYSMIPSEAANKAVSVADRRFQRPNIYEYSLATKQSKLLIKDGYHPLPSPDGQWIAFYGSLNPDKPVPLYPDPMPEMPRNFWRFRAAGASLCVARRDGTGRIGFAPFNGTYPLLCWRADNRHLFIVEQTQLTPKAAAKITEWDIASQNFRIVTSLQANREHRDEEIFIRPRFAPLGISNDDQTLYIRMKETDEVRNDDFIVSVNLKTGATAKLMRISHDNGFDWFSPSITRVGTASLNKGFTGEL